MNVKNLVCQMLTEGTGQALCDSGGYLGRHWEKNQKKTLEDFENEPEVTTEIYTEGDVQYSISLFHWLIGQLEVDSVCDAFNALNSNAENWDGGLYGTCKNAFAFLMSIAKEGSTFNSYNGESALSQVIQGTHITIKNEPYVLLQIHQGCDVRGGYTDAKLFKVKCEFFGSEDVFGTITKHKFQMAKNSKIGKMDLEDKVIQIDNTYNGHSLTDEEGKEIKAKEGDTIKLNLSNY